MWKTILAGKEIIGTYNELVQKINASGLLGNKMERI
jgi:hypothetical protein